MSDFETVSAAAGTTRVSIAAFDCERVEVLKRLLAQLVEGGSLGGGVLGVADRGGATLLHAFGSAGPTESGVPARADHRFLLTSVTKPFTATQVLQLVEDGAIDLQAPVAAYIPEFAANGKERVTTRQLLTHTSGMNQASNTTEAFVSSLEAGEHLRHALDASLSWQSGTWFEYNSPAFWVLAELVTRLTGVHYTAHLRDRVLGPLGMRDTGYETGADPPERYVQPWSSGRGPRAEQVRRLAYPAGGLIGTAGDLLRFGCCLLNRGSLGTARVLGPASVEAIWRPYVETTYKGRETHWGLGWQLGGPGDLRSERSLFQWGGSGTALWVDPDHELSIVLLTATWNLDWRIYGQIANAVLGCLAADDTVDPRRVVRQVEPTDVGSASKRGAGASTSAGGTA